MGEFSRMMEVFSILHWVIKLYGFGFTFAKIQRPVDLRCGCLALLRSAVSTEERKRGREGESKAEKCISGGLALC